MKNVSEKSCKGNQNTFCVQYFFYFENRAVCEIMLKYMVERGRPQMTVWRTRIACWIHKAKTHTHTHTHTHPGCAIPIAFPLQQRPHGCATMLRYTYLACRVLTHYVDLTQEDVPPMVCVCAVYP